MVPPGPPPPVLTGESRALGRTTGRTPRESCRLLAGSPLLVLALMCALECVFPKIYIFFSKMWVREGQWPLTAVTTG